MAHIADFLWDERCATWLGLQPVPREPPYLTPGSTEDAIAVLRRANEVYRGYLITADDASYTTPMGEVAGHYGSQPGMGSCCTYWRSWLTTAPK